MCRFPRFSPLSALLACASGALFAAPPTEQDYFTELPEVLTVTRLAQPLSETPGAVTIIDRETIRRSGAREVADLLRLVPGYLVGGWNGANPTAVYHAPVDEYGTRNLVLIDGRSVYSSFFLGDTHRGLMGVPLEDIERIEVLRGSNSAAYGANALFGVINIITRHSDDTLGAEFSVTGGEGSIGDRYARIGWGNDRASFRVTAGHRSDSGYLQAHDDKKISLLNFRSDLHLAADQELMLSAGVVSLDAGDGFPGQLNNGNPERTQSWRSAHLQGVWQRQLSPGEQIKLSASYDQENARDDYPYHLAVGGVYQETVKIDFGGRGRRLNLELQHQFSPADSLRVVWGAGYKYEDALSLPLYATDSPVSLREQRLFGNIEWRPHERWLINAGAFAGSHSRKGGYFMPRLMVNFHLQHDHTLRAGVGRSARMPNLYELTGDRSYQTATYGLLRYDKATGTVAPEILFTEEFGYFGYFRPWHLTLDIRAYRESMRGAIDKYAYNLPGYATQKVNDFVNTRNLTIQGFEVQARWKPRQGTDIWISHSDMRRRWSDSFENHDPPQRLSTLALFQQLPGNFELGLIHSFSAAMTWHDPKRRLPKIRRTDARLAYSFRYGTTRIEAAANVQAADGNYVASHLDIAHPRMIQERRAFGTLRIEF